MKKKILMFLLLSIIAIITLGGMSESQAARICSSCQAGNHVNCPNRGYTHNATSHSIWCCCGKTFANAEKHYNNHYLNDPTYCYICVCGYREKHNTNGGHCSKAHCPYHTSKTLCDRGCNHAKWVNCRDHSYSSTWSRNTTHHWKKCIVTSSCNSTRSYGVHVDDNGDGKCDICEFAEGTTTPTNDGGGGDVEATDPKPGDPILNVKGTNYTGTGSNNIIYSNTDVSWNLETEDSTSNKPLKLTEYDLSGATTGGNAVTRAGRYNRNGSNAAVTNQWISSIPSTYTFETWIYLPVYGGKNYYIFHTGRSRFSQIFISTAGDLILYNSSREYQTYIPQSELARLGFYSGWSYLSVQAKNSANMNMDNVVVYVNGQKATAKSSGSGIKADMSKSRLQLGGYATTNNTGLPDGSMMKETKIFNTGVAASSANRMYTEMNSNTANWSNLIGYWKQVETSGTTLTATVGVNGVYGSNADASTTRDVSSSYTDAALTDNKFTGTITAEGTTRITANHVGMHGATSETIVDVVIDKTPPTGTIYASAANTNQSTVKLYVTASDDSGIGGVNINAWFGGNWSQYVTGKPATYNAETELWEVEYSFSEIPNTTTGATNQGEGIYYFDAHIYDKAGNMAVVSQITVAYDTTSPWITGAMSTEGLTGSEPTFYTRDVTGTVTLNSTGIADNLSGPSYFDYYIRRDGAERTTDYNAGQNVDESTGTGYVKYKLNGQGTYISEKYIYDRAGNLAKCADITIIADNEGPWIYQGSVSGATKKDDGKYYVTDATGEVTLNYWDMGDNLSGLSHFDYYLSKDGAPRTKDYNTGTAITTDGENKGYVKYKFNGYGTYTTEIYIYDKAGNLSVNDVKTFVVAPDGSEGVIYTEASLTNKPTVKISVEAKDDNSGVNNVKIYAWKGTTTEGNNTLGQGFVGGDATYNSATGRWERTFTFSELPDRITCETNQGDGIYAFDAHVVNNSGTDTYIDPVHVTYDATNPEIYSISYAPGWTNKAITKTVEARDNLSGVRLLEYSYDLNTWYSDWDSTGTGIATKTWDGERDEVLYFRATDYAGNTWIYAFDGVNPSPYDLKIDKTAPTGTVTASARYTNQNSVKISVSAQDALSGVNNVKIIAWTGSETWVTTNTEKDSVYNAETGLWEVTFTFDEIRDTTTGALNQGDGNYYFGAHIYDKAGNSLVVDGTTVTYDTTPPEITSITYDPGWKNVNIKKYIESNDTLSGVGLLEYSYDLNTWYSDWDSATEGYANKTWTEEGDRVVYFRATDNAGNTKVYAFDGVNPSSYDLKIDKTKPVIGTYTVSGTMVRGGRNYVTNNAAEITLNFTGMSDNLSGLSRFDVYMKKDGAARTDAYNLSQSIDAEAGTGTVTYKLNGYGTYATEIYLYDVAGNVAGYQNTVIEAVESIPLPELMERDLWYYEDEIPSMLGARRTDPNTTYLASKVKTISIINLTKEQAPATYEATWDVSYIDGQETVTAWVVKNSEDATMYDLIIGANDVILVPENAGYLFAYYENLESIEGLNNFDTSNMTTTEGMFEGCTIVQNIDISTFNTTEVETMVNMFLNCSGLTKINLSNLNTTKVTSMSSMFSGCASLENIDLGNLDTTNVTDMSSMFSGCSSLKSIDLRNLNTINVTTMEYIFENCDSLKDIKLSGLDTSSLGTIEGMFTGATSLETVDLSDFDMTTVIAMSYLFKDCTSLKYVDLKNAYVPGADPSLEMFRGCTNLTSIRLGENFSTLNPENAFSGCINLKAIIVESETPLTLDTTGGLSTLTNAILYVPSQTAKTTYESATNYSTVFGADRIRPILGVAGDNPAKAKQNGVYDATVDAGATIAGFTKAESSNYTQYGYDYVTSGLPVDTTTPGTKQVTYTLTKTENGATTNGMSVTRDVNVVGVPKLMERENADYISGKNVYYAIGARRSDNKKYIADLINSITFVNNVNVPTEAEASWDVSFTDGAGEVIAWVIPNTTDSTKYDLYIGADDTTIQAAENSSNLFRDYKNCISINNLTMLDTSKVTDMSDMFCDCSSLTSLDVSNFNTSKVTDMSSMFYYCKSLTSLDVNNFNTSKATNMSYMFYYCSSLTSLDVNNFDTSKVTAMSNMFNGCKSLTILDVSSFDTSKVTNMSYMFQYCSSLSSLDVSNFDTSNVTTMIGMFSRCNNLPSLDVSNFDTSNVTSMSSMFYNCSSLTSIDVSNFDTSNVTSMGSLFAGCSNLLSIDVSNFDTSNVTSMFEMFFYCNSLTNLDISNFDTSKVTNMSYMFQSCSNLTNLDVSNFDTSKVTNMSYMFQSCNNLTSLDVSNFDTSKVTNMSYMFSVCSSLTSLDLSNFNTSNVTNMGSAFFNCNNLTSINLTNFNTSKVTNMNILFWKCSNLKAIIVDKAITSSDEALNLLTGTNLENLHNAILYVHDSDSEKLYETAINYSTIFADSRDTADDLYRVRPILELVGDNPAKVANGGTYVDSGVTVAGMNENTDDTYTPYGYTVSGPVIKKDGTVISNIDTSTKGSYTYTYTIKDSENTEGMSVTRDVAVKGDAILMKRDKKTDGDTEKFYAIGSYERLRIETYTADKIKTITLKNTLTVPTQYTNAAASDKATWDVSFTNGDETVTAWIVKNSTDSTMYDLYIGAEGTIYAPDDSSKLFANYTNCTTITGLDNLDTSNVINMSIMFNANSKLQALDLSKFNTEKVISMDWMLGGCSSLSTLDLSSFDTSNVTNMSGMFNECTGLASLDLAKFNTSKVTDMSMMFSTCTGLETINVSSFDTSNVTTMGWMFFKTSKLTSLDLTNFNTANVTSMSGMFGICTNLSSLNVGSFNTSKVTDMSSMFSGCSNLQILDVSSFITTEVTTMQWMFNQCQKLSSLNLSKFNTSKVTNMSGMFSGCENIKTINLYNFDTSKVTTMEWMFTGCYEMKYMDLSAFDTRNTTNLNDLFRGCTKIESVKLGQNFDKLTGTNMFSGCTTLKAIITPRTTIMTLNDDTTTSTGLKTLTNAVLYVPSVEAEATFEADANYADILGADRIRPILELVGDNLAKVANGGTYVDSGVTVAGMTENADDTYTLYGYTVFGPIIKKGDVTVTNIDTSTKGTYTYTYTVVDPDGVSGMSVTRTVEIESRDISENNPNITVTLPTEERVYKDAEYRPVVTVKDGTTTLTENTDFTVSYSDNINAGKATITITGINNYTGSRTENFMITKRPITIKPKDATKEYDTLPLTSNVAEVTAGSLVSGHTVTITTTGTITNVGSVDNTISTLTIKNASGTDVTANYNVTKAKGTLTITSAGSVEFDITLDNDTFEYDGTVKEPTATVKVGSETLVAGTDYDVSYKNNKDAGTATVTITGKGNYAGSIGTKEFTITKRVIEITAGSATKTYDGTALTSSKFEVTKGSIAPNQTLSVTTSGSITNVGSTPNKVATYKVMASSEDVTKNYTVTIVDGTLTVTDATITGSVKITGNNIYGETLTAEVTTVPTGCTLTYNWYYADSSSATSGTSMGTGSTVVLNNAAYIGKYVFVKVTASKTNYNVATFTDVTDAENNGSATVKDASVVIITNPANVAVKEGVAASFSVVASGTNLKYQWYKADSSTGAGTVITGATSATYSISVANMVRGLNGTYYYCIVSNTIGNATSTRALLTVYYAPSISTQPTDKTVNVGEKATFTITVNNGNPSATTYQWQYRTSATGTWTNCTSTQGTGYNTASFTTVTTTMAMNGYEYRCIIGNAQYPSSQISNAATLTVNKLNISPKVNMTGYTYGETLSTPNVTGNTGNGTVTYYYNTTNSNANGTNWNTVTSSTSLNAGTYYMYAVIGATTNYNGATTAAVPFVVAKRDITIKPKDAAKVYDTLPLTSNVAEVTAGSLVSGHTVTITTSGSITNVGSVDNTISTLTIKNASGTDVTANYNVTKAKGTLTITSAGSVDFDITLNNNTFEYDGTAKEPTATVKVGSKTLVAGTDYDVSYKNNKDAGTATVTITGKGNYAGSIGTKEFTITKRVIEITAGSATKTYDGTALTSSKFEITKGSIAPNQTLSVTTSGSITNVGSTSNKVATYKVMASSEDVTKNYTVTTVDGTLTVTSATITGSVKITGQAIYGETLTAEVTVVPADCTLTYVWYMQRGQQRQTITDATNSTLVLGSDQVGKIISVQVTAQKTNYTSKAFTDMTDVSTNGSSTVLQKDLTSPDIEATINPITFVYSGAENKPTVTVYDREILLDESTDYTVSYSNNVEVGTGTVTITGMGNYKGSIEKQFTITKASVTPKVNMTGYTYGETLSTPNVTGNTGNGTVTYYYNTTNLNTNGTNWNTVTSSTSLNAGTYYMYAVIGATTNYNGATTAAVPFVVAKRDITIKPKDAAKVYDTLPLTSNVAEVTAGSLVSGHTVTITTSGSITNVGSIENTISTLTIKDASGTDVTANYNVTKAKGTLTITSAGSVDFDITLNNDTFEYDGTAKEPTATVKVGSETLVAGTDYDVSYKNNKDAGTATVTITGKGNYAGSIGTKEFTITKRVIEITAGSATKTYDGTALTSSKFEVTSGSLAPNQTLSVTTSGSITNVGSTPNKVATYKVMSGTEDVTKNYTVTTIDGILTVTAKADAEFNITLDNDTFEYDGTEKEPEVTIKVDGKTLEEGTDYDVSYKDNVDAGTATVTITGKGNYEGSIGEKTFEITKRKITIKANDDSKVYDTLPLTNNTYKVTNGSIAANHVMTVTIEGTITNVGSVPNVITSVVIKDASNKDVTKNYDITKQNGTLTITAAESVDFDITLDKDTFVYDGTAKEPTATVKVGNTTLTEGTDYEVSYKDNVKAGTATVIITGKGNYQGATGEKTFTITKADITPTVNMSDYVYGGIKAEPSINGNTENGNVTYYYNTSNSNINGTNWNTVTSSRSLNAGTYYMYAVIEETENYKGAITPTKEFRITSIDISENNPDVTATIPTEERIYKDAEYRPEVTLKNGTETLEINKDYTVSYKNNVNAGMATITITGINNYSGSRTINFMISKRPITIKPKDATKVYDTLPLTSNVAEVTVGSLVSGHTATITTTGSITNVGSIENTISTLTIKNASGTDVTENYEITQGIGTLTVTAAGSVDFDITLDNDTFEYDGTAKEPTVTVKVGNKTLVAGTDYDVSYKNNKDAGTATVTITGKGNYEGSTGNKEFTITKRLLEITAGSKEKIYDGTPLTSSTFSITSGTSLAPNQTLSATTSGTITNVGTTSNIIATYSIYHAGDNVTSNYNVTLKAGILEVKPATITGSVVIKGTNRVGKTLTAEVTVTPSDTTLTYAWYYGSTNNIESATAITGANTKTYSPTSDKIGMYIFVKVVASKENYNNATFTDVTDNENNKVEKVGDRLTPYLMAREVQTITTNGVTSEKAGYAIGAYRAGETKYTSDLIKSITIINLLETSAPTTYEAMWDASNKLDESVYAWVVKNQTNSSMYDLYIGGEGVVTLTSGKRLFADYTKCNNINGLDKVNSNSVTDMSYMFSNLSAMNSLDVTIINTSSVTNMEGMFMDNNITTLNVTGFDTSKVTNMSKMFKNNSKLTSLNIKGFNTVNATNMSQMFMNCSEITALDVSAFNTNKVTNMSGMFMGLSKIESIGVTNFNTANVTDMSMMFANCLKVQRLDLHTFNTAKVTNMSSMFTANASMKSILLGEEFNKLNGSNMFVGCSSLRAIIAQKKINSSSEAMVLSATDTGLNTLVNAVLYVPNLESKGYYETATNYMTVFGEARVKPILEIIGANPTYVTVGNVYVDPGAKVAGFEEANASEYTVYGYTLTTSGLPVDTTTVGTKLVIYTVRYKDQIVVTGATW